MESRQHEPGTPEDVGNLSEDSQTSPRRFETRGGPVSPEQVRSNLGTLEGNLNRVRAISGETLRSPEGEQATKNLKEKISGAFSGFQKGLLEKMSKVGDVVRSERVMALGVAASFGAWALPVVMFRLRAQYPEIGMMLDAAPEMVQQLVHTEVFANIMNKVTGASWPGSVWSGGGQEGQAFLANIASPNFDISTLSHEALDEALPNLNERDVEFLKMRLNTGVTQKVQEVAKGIGTVSAVLKGSTNAALLFLTSLVHSL